MSEISYRLAGKNQKGRFGKSDRARVIRCILSLWEALTFTLRNNRTYVDDNAAEPSIRPMCLGHKNWLFVGSATGEERAATAYSLIQTAELNGFHSADYLRQAPAGIAQHQVNWVDELPPWKRDSVQYR